MQHEIKYGAKIAELCNTYTWGHKMFSFKKILISIIAAVIMASFALTAIAGPIAMVHFKYTCASCSIKTQSFDLALSPTVSSFDSTSFTINNVLTSLGVEDLTFFSTLSGGGFQSQQPGGGPIDTDAATDQLFSGALNAPMFLPNTFATIDSRCDLGCAGTLVISTAIPEPATLSLVGVALVGFGALRGKKSTGLKS